MANTTRVDVPKSAGDEITVRYRGGDPITYKVRDGHVTVDDRHVEKFLGAVEGSKASAGNTDASDRGE